MYKPHIETTIFILCFFVFFLIYLFRKTAKNSLDLYDFLVLSSVAIIPVIFVLAPDFVGRISQLVGVQYPFVLLFAALITVLFTYQIYLISRLRKLQRQISILVQENAIAKTTPPVKK